MTAALARGKGARSQETALQGIAYVANPELGAKQVCPNCQAKFYDLNKRPAVCPKCHTEFDPDEAVRSRRVRGRAAAPEHEAEDEDREDQVKARASDDEEDHRQRTVWPWVIGVLALALIGLGGLWWFDSARSDTYFVAVNDHDEFVIEQGMKNTLFGREMHKPVQQVCINDENQIRLVNSNNVPGDCHLFALSDLPESTQGRVHNLGTGSYADITDQLNRLADDALPACVDQSDAGKCREVK